MTNLAPEDLKARNVHNCVRCVMEDARSAVKRHSHCATSCLLDALDALQVHAAHYKENA